MWNTWHKVHIAHVSNSELWRGRHINVYKPFGLMLNSGDIPFHEVLRYCSTVSELSILIKSSHLSERVSNSNYFLWTSQESLSHMNSNVALFLKFTTLWDIKHLYKGRPQTHVNKENRICFDMKNNSSCLFAAPWLLQLLGLVKSALF